MIEENKSSMKNSVRRLIIAGIGVLIQIIWVVVLVMRLNQYSQIITLLTVAIELVLVLAVYSMDTNAAFKLPWIILITVAPIVGICVFFLFGRSGATKKVRARYRKIDQQLFAYLNQDEQIIEELSKKDERLANDFKYLWKCASSPVYKNTDVKYYGDTCDAMAAQLEDMMQAKKFIFLEYHAIEMAESFQALRKVLMAKAREGVEIRILYDDAGCIGFLNPRFIKYMESMGIQCRVFNPIMPVLNIFMNNRDHRKITVIDGKVAYTGGYNLADENVYDKVAKSLSAKMHKAMAVIQLKLIGQMVHRHPEYHMEDRNLLEHIDYEKGLYKYNGITCPLTDTNFPTVDPQNPLELTQKEAQLMDVLAASFAHSEALQRHVRFLYSSGSMYLCMNGNLLFHGCIPMNEDGSFERVEVDGEKYAGRALLDRLERAAREAYFLPKDHPDKQKNVDKMWLLWCSAQSPLFGKSRMSAFERYFTKEKALHEEVYNSYYRLSADSYVCEQILKEFGVDPVHGHIINGHVPVRQKDGENPVKADGKLYVIDGGLSKAYQAKTGIAGYTLIFNSHYLALAQHHDYISHPLSKPESDDMPTLQITQKMDKRILVSDTDAGKKLSQRIEELHLLVKAYENGSFVERAIAAYPKTTPSLHMETMEIVR